MWGPWSKSVVESSGLFAEIDLLVTELQRPCSSARLSGCWLLGWSIGKSSASPAMHEVREVTCRTEARQLLQELFAPDH